MNIAAVNRLYVIHSLRNGTQHEATLETRNQQFQGKE